ncbi:MAG: hypothetical protein ACPGR8_15775 [Limisphaerales bacterium]
MIPKGMIDGETMVFRDTKESDRRHLLAEKIQKLVSSNDDVLMKLVEKNLWGGLDQRLYSGIPEDQRKLAADRAMKYFRAFISAVRAGGDAYSLSMRFLDELEDETAWEIYDEGRRIGRTASVGPSRKSGSNRETHWGETVETPCGRMGKYLRRVALAMLDQEGSKEQRQAKLWKALTTPIASIFTKLKPIERPTLPRIMKVFEKPLNRWNREDMRVYLNWIGVWTFSLVKAKEGKTLVLQTIADLGLESDFDAVARKPDKLAGSGLGHKSTGGPGHKSLSEPRTTTPTATTFVGPALVGSTTTADIAMVLPGGVKHTNSNATANETTTTNQSNFVNIVLPGGVPHPPRFNPAAVEPTTTIKSPQPEAGPAPGRLPTAFGSTFKLGPVKRPRSPDSPPGIDAPIDGGSAALHHHDVDKDVVGGIPFFSSSKKRRLKAGANIDPRKDDSWVATAAGLPPTGQPRGTAI